MGTDHTLTEACLHDAISVLETVLKAENLTPVEQ
jgi:hypothetical protein